MSPGGHLVTTAAACAVIYAGTGSPALTAGLAAGGFLIDVDHVVDYVLFERQRDLRPAAFLKHYLGGQVQRAVLVLHSYELLVLLAALAWMTGIEWLWGWVFGMLLHLPLDVIFNGKFASGGLAHFYSFIVRARAGFRIDRFADRARRPVTDDPFWIAFFRGAQLADDRQHVAAPAVRRARASEPLRG
ncbi:MAG TPA: hypothetical protein VL086_14780 [Candidatus Nitrosotalea sp.]|jgi:hypothetical protein|nr:hypothetical protein [Candidatus Nitrosotalea sp.]